ncbi:TD and POZ domain-containing protein 4 [Nephila pilipes]|uniref:TD and POZ domain-containing protein 4 n=1 Tax=Nephila pilipes TaxID=299642 RepID=A0A8X6Q268_NEPPI|nr:TD and POZ domain-containing protein 4 [Nephila pilipes]
MASKFSKENEEFEFTWRIENYSLLQQARGSCLDSPSFTMGILNKTKWHLSFYPKGKSDDFITCDIYRETDTGSGSLSINSQFSILLAEGIAKHEFKEESNTYSPKRSTSHKLMEITTLLEQKHLLVPRDNLTIQCRMWLSDPGIPSIVPTPAIKALVACLCDDKNENNSDLPDVMYMTTGAEVMDLKKKLYPYLNKCSARTHLGIERMSFVWPIKNFSSLKVNQKFSVPLQSASKKIPSFILTVTLVQDDIQIKINKIIEKGMGTIFMNCRLAVLDHNGREHTFSEKEHNFGSPSSNEEWIFPSFFTKSKMIEQYPMCLPNDILSLQCNFNISAGDTVSVIEESHFISLACDESTKQSEIGSLQEDINALYLDKKLFDVNLRIGDKTLPAHKAVLGSRSPVFRAMFDHDTKEKNSNVVDIPDVDLNTLARMLTFIYSDDIDKLNPDRAMKLYSAADKYQIDSLRKKCSEYLESNMTSKNVYKILVLANIHQDKRLRNSAEEFLFKPPYEAMLSVEFEAFIDNHIHLARETLRKWINKIKSEMALEI